MNMIFLFRIPPVVNYANCSQRHNDILIGANCPQTSGTVPRMTALSPSPQRGTDLSPNADSERVFQFSERFILTRGLV